MLAGKQCCRRNKGNLKARHRGDEGGTQCHLGLTEADIAANQPVCRPPGRQIIHHIGNGIDLILGLDKTEAITEFGIRTAVYHQRFASCRLALCRNLDQLLCHDPHTALDTGHACLPCGTT